jgi:nitroreductase
VMGDPAARSAAGVRDDERIVAIVNVGEPAEPVPPKKREPAASFTRWVP